MNGSLLLGIGASLGPMIMGAVARTRSELARRLFSIARFQTALAILLFAAIPAWETAGRREIRDEAKLLTLGQAIRIPLAAPMFVSLFCYCGLELTAGLWSASYATVHYGIAANTAAAWTSLFYLGLTAGRALAGFISFKLDNPSMIRVGQCFGALGLLLLLLPVGVWRIPAAYFLTGFGCAPIYPAMLHQTPLTSARRIRRRCGDSDGEAYLRLDPDAAGLRLTRPARFDAPVPDSARVLLAVMIVCTETVRRKAKARG